MEQKKPPITVTIHWQGLPPEGLTEEEAEEVAQLLVAMDGAAGSPGMAAHFARELGRLRGCAAEGSLTLGCPEELREEAAAPEPEKIWYN